MALDPANVKRRLYAAAQDPAHQGELALAARAWFAGPPDPEDWPDFLDFFALEWVDAEGWTLLERVEGPTLPPELLRWGLELRSGVFVVDDHQGRLTRLRDLRSEEVLPALLPELLPARSLLVGRLLPWGEVWLPSGQPDVHDPMSALRRIDLVQRWASGPRAALSERMAELRRSFVVQREQRQVFVDCHGADLLIFEQPDALAEAMRRFMQRLLLEARLPSLGGRTHAELRAQDQGLSVPAVDVRLGEGLRGEVGVIFDEVEGLHFLPRLGEFMSYMNNELQHDEIIHLYANDPGVSRLPFRRAGAPERLAQALSVPPGPLEELLDLIKPRTRASPSLMPGFEVAEGL
ncbi:MAG: hypothetical protein H6741_04100 [Alphaproteobacteria bacterium]|nr:hypothetical protein [Alphaproteobacteria bacterium]